MNKPPPQFISDFNLVMNYYEVEREDANHEKRKWAESPYEIEKSYSIIAAGVRAMLATSV